jgi:hypothetical protein
LRQWHGSIAGAGPQNGFVLADVGIIKTSISASLLTTSDFFILGSFCKNALFGSPALFQPTAEKKGIYPHITQMDADEEFLNRRERRKPGKKLCSLFAPVQGCFPYPR